MEDTQMKSYRMPLWFRATVAALFFGVFGVYFLVKDGLTRQAMAWAPFNEVLGSQRPMLNLQAVLAKQRQEPEGGAYRINGVRVGFRNLPAPMGPRNALVGFQSMFQRAGYKYKLTQIQGEVALVGFHPKTGMMIMVQPRRDSRGRSTVRITEHNLGDALEDFKAEIPGIPMLPDAARPMLTQALDGPRSESLMYAVRGAPDWASEFYAHELAIGGWKRMVPPIPAPPSLLSAMFFQRNGQECSVVAVGSPETQETLVLVTLTEPAKEVS